MIKSLSDLRKELKELGFKIKTERMSWGRHATYVHTATGEGFMFNVCDKQTFDRWAPLCKFLRDHRDEVIALKETEGLFGLQQFKDPSLLPIEV